MGVRPIGLTKLHSIRTYSELATLKTFVDRYNYLKLDGHVGIETFGADRYLNQSFYHSAEWKRIRDKVIVRDMGCDLGIEGRDLFKYIFIHHMNAIDGSDLLTFSHKVIDPEFLICCSRNTHQAIHYGDSSLLLSEPIERSKFDTCPWRTA